MHNPQLGKGTFWVCSSCIRRQRLLRSVWKTRPSAPYFQQRSISEKYIAKEAEAETQWKSYHEDIKAGKRQSMLSILEERGYINAVAG